MQTETVISHLNFSSVNGQNPKFNLFGLRDWQIFFPNLQSVNLSGYTIPNFDNMKPGIFGDIEVIIDHPEDFEASDSSEASGCIAEVAEEQFYEHWVMENATCPQLRLRKVTPCYDDEFSEEEELTLDMFPLMEIDEESATLVDNFISHYFESLWTDIEYAEHLYAECSVFSLSIDPDSSDPAILEYSDVVANCKIREYTRCVGRGDITQALEVLFPDGFHARPERMESRELIPNMFAVVVYGVFEHITGKVLGFRKCLTVGYAGGVVQIMNDHMHIHRVA